MGRFYGRERFDPRKIILQIVAMQALYYFTLCALSFVFVSMLGLNWHAGLVLDASHFSAFTSLGWALIAALFITALASAAYLALVVERVKKSLDFAFTLYFMDVVCVSVSAEFPQNSTWWLTHAVCFVITAALGEYLCLKREMQEISVEDILRGGRARQRTLSTSSSAPPSARDSSGGGSARSQAGGAGVGGGAGAGAAGGGSVIVHVAGSGAGAVPAAQGGSASSSGLVTPTGPLRGDLRQLLSPPASLASNVSAALTHAIDRLQHLPVPSAAGGGEGTGVLLRRGFASATTRASTWLSGATSSALAGGYGGYSRVNQSDWEPTPVMTRHLPGSVSYSATPRKGTAASAGLGPGTDSKALTVSRSRQESQTSLASSPVGADSGGSGLHGGVGGSSSSFISPAAAYGHHAGAGGAARGYSTGTGTSFVPGLPGIVSLDLATMAQTPTTMHSPATTTEVWPAGTGTGPSTAAPSPSGSSAVGGQISFDLAQPQATVIRARARTGQGGADMAGGGATGAAYAGGSAPAAMGSASGAAGAGAGERVHSAAGVGVAGRSDPGGVSRGSVHAASAGTAAGGSSSGPHASGAVAPGAPGGGAGGVRGRRDTADSGV